MEKRRFERISGCFDAEIIYKGKAFRGIIDNLSENGAQALTIPGEIKIDFIPGSILDLKFQPCPGETLVLNCRIKWSKKVLPHGLKYKIGLEVLDPPWDKSNCSL